MPKAFSESEKQLIRAKLLEQGNKQFSTFGLKKTNVDELARAAGISKGAFYIFYDSKESLFMDVVEELEKRVRRQILAIVDLPGPSPRARLFAVLKGAFNLFKTTPLLQILTGNDFDVLMRRVPPEKFQQHLASDGVFFAELLDRCRKAGIPITAPPDKISGLAYQLVLALMHEDDMSRNNFGGSIDLLLELIAAYCLGEVETQLQKKESENEFSH
jgi:AcrR family transcriptional regulator